MLVQSWCKRIKVS